MEASQLPFRRMSLALATMACIATPSLAQEIDKGRQLVETYCVECHNAAPEGGPSPLPGAPAFNTLHQRYDVDQLEEALVEGLVTGHDTMPEFEFDPNQARAIIDYLKGLETLRGLPAGDPSQRPASVPFGELTFQFYCTTCHGAQGRADTEAAAMFSATDLTYLASANGGVFPAERIRNIIDGREELVGHTDVRMPPWARLFAHELATISSDQERERLIGLRIADLVAYLQSIQVE
jgi:cytochrome c